MVYLFLNLLQVQDPLCRSQEGKSRVLVQLVVFTFSTTHVLLSKGRPAQLIAILLELNVMFEDENPDMLVKELMDTLVKGLALSISKIPFSIYKPPELKETPDGDHVLPPV